MESSLHKGDNLALQPTPAEHSVWTLYLGFTLCLFQQAEAEKARPLAKAGSASRPSMSVPFFLPPYSVFMGAAGPTVVSPRSLKIHHHVNVKSLPGVFKQTASHLLHSVSGRPINAAALHRVLGVGMVWFISLTDV